MRRRAESGVQSANADFPDVAAAGFNRRMIPADDPGG
jgi:hypothetical protein